LTYTLTYTNIGLGPATGILITDVVPVTLTHVSVISSSAQITPIGNISYTWQVEDLSPGESGVIILTGLVSPPVGGVFSLTNRATITTTEACFVDANLGDNAAVARNTVDAQRPEIVAKTPASGAIDVPSTAPVIITFSESISTDTFTYTVDPDPGNWSETWDNSAALVTLTHRPFVYSKTHSIAVTAADDLVGNSLSEAPYTWHFDTELYRVYLPVVLRNW
jgi:uncharacterized repeat protein (TIGR01451 family)